MNEFQFNCPKCGQNILATTDWTGRPMTCPSCETRLVIPERDAPAATGRSGSGVRPIGIAAPPKVRMRVKLPAKTESGPARRAPRRRPSS